MHQAEEDVEGIARLFLALRDKGLLELVGRVYGASVMKWLDVESRKYSAEEQMAFFESLTSPSLRSARELGGRLLEDMKSAAKAASKRVDSRLERQRLDDELWNRLSLVTDFLHGNQQLFVGVSVNGLTLLQLADNAVRDNSCVGELAKHMDYAVRRLGSVPPYMRVFDIVKDYGYSQYFNDGGAADDQPEAAQSLIGTTESGYDRWLAGLPRGAWDGFYENVLWCGDSPYEYRSRGPQPAWPQCSGEIWCLIDVAGQGQQPLRLGVENPVWAPPDNDYWSATEAPNVVYHATTRTSAVNIAQEGIRSIDNGWGPGGGRLGKGFYTHEDSNSAAAYVNGTPIVLQFAVAPCNGALAPMDQGLRLGDLPKDEYDSINNGQPFLAYQENTGRELKFNDATKLKLVAISEDLVNYFNPEQWLSAGQM